jgi:hypothetical protein
MDCAEKPMNCVTLPLMWILPTLGLVAQEV